MRSGCCIDEKDAVSSWCSGGGACQSQELRQWAWPKGPITVLMEPVTAFLIETRLLDIKVMELSFSFNTDLLLTLDFRCAEGALRHSGEQSVDKGGSVPLLHSPPGLCM